MTGIASLLLHNIRGQEVGRLERRFLCKNSLNISENRMKLWSTTHIFRHAWETVTQAAWRKYPNEYNPHVKAIDVLDRHVDEEGRLVTKRVMGTQWNLPSWALYILGLEDMCYGFEHSVVDPKAKTMTLKGRNLTFSGVVGIEENLEYSQHPEDKNATIMKQEAVVTVFGLSFSSYCEKLITDTYDANSKKGRQAMEHILGVINQEIHDLASGIEQATTKLNTEFEHATAIINSELNDIAQGAKQGLEQAASLQAVFCENNEATSR